MSIARGYANDLFVSYSLVDDRNSGDDEKGWVQQFVRRLEVDLWKRAGEQPSIWRDAKLAGADIFDEVIQHHIRASGLFLALISPAYLNSVSSRQELKTFVDAARLSAAGLAPNDHGRVLPVLLYDLPHDKLPEEVRSVVGFPFYSVTDEISVPIAWGDERYHRMLVRVADSALRCLRALPPPGEVSSSTSGPAAPSPPPTPSDYKPRGTDDIFISYAREDFAAAQALARKLVAENWRVFWDRSIPIGRTWDAVLEEKLNTVPSVVVLWSRASIKSEWVLVEANEAADQTKLVPVFIEDVKPPLRFRRLQGAQLVGWDRESDTLDVRSVIEALRGLIKAQDQAS